MRVLYVTNSAHLRSTSRSLDAIIKCLRGKGLDPYIVFGEAGPWQEQLLESGIPCFMHALRIPAKEHLARSLYDVLWLAQLVRRRRIDLIHCNEHDHYPLIRLVGRLLRVPVLVTVRFYFDKGFGNWAFKPPYVPVCLQFTSQDLLQSCALMLPLEVEAHRLKLVLNGMDMDGFLSRGSGSAGGLRATWGASAGSVIVGTASGIQPNKNLLDFVRMIGRLRRQGLLVQGVIAGGGRYADLAYEQQLRNLIRQEHLAETCLMVGNLDPITDFMSAIDVFVSTSAREAFGMSTCEAMTCRKPAVVYDAGGIAEVVHDPWCVVALGDLETLTEKVASLVKDPEFRTVMGQRAERYVREHFDAPALAHRQAMIYEEIMGQEIFCR